MILVSGGHLLKECTGFIEVDVMTVPVDDHIHAFFYCCIHHSFDQLHRTSRIREVPTFGFHAQRSSYHVAVPVFHQPLHGTGCVESWMKTTPSKTYSIQHQRFVMLVNELRSGDF